MACVFQKRYPRRGSTKSTKGKRVIHEGRKGKNISTKGHEERRRATKGLEEAQEGSAKGRQGEKGFPRKGKRAFCKIRRAALM